jgi:hypothetical protein
MSLLFDAFKFLKGDSTGKVSEEKKLQRLDICKKCTYKITTINFEICDFCGCVVEEKTKYKDEKCPINKW